MLAETQTHNPLSKAKQVLSVRFNFDLMYNGEHYEQCCSQRGAKLSIQGETLEDAATVLVALGAFLTQRQTPFKVATVRRIEYKEEGTTLRHQEQSRKIATIYLREEIDIKSFAKAVYERLCSVLYFGFMPGILKEGLKELLGCVHTQVVAEDPLHKAV